MTDGWCRKMFRVHLPDRRAEYLSSVGAVGRPERAEKSHDKKVVRVNNGTVRVSIVC